MSENEIKAENFEEMLESSLKTLNTGDTVTGYVTNVTDAELQLDVGAKVTGIIKAEQISDDPSFKLSENFKVGDEIDAFVIRVSDIEGVAVRYDFAVGAFTVIVGALLLWRAPTMVGILSVVIGLFILVDCVFKLQVAIDSRRMGASSWWVTLLFTCVCMVMGFLLVFDPFSGQQVLATVMGISLIADGLQNLCTVIYAAVFVKDVKDAVRDMVDEATAVETTGEVVEDGDPKQ